MAIGNVKPREKKGDKSNIDVEGVENVADQAKIHTGKKRGNNRPKVHKNISISTTPEYQERFKKLNAKIATQGVVCRQSDIFKALIEIAEKMDAAELANAVEAMMLEDSEG